MRSYLLGVCWLLGTTVVGGWQSIKDQPMKVTIRSKNGLLNANLSSTGLGVSREEGGYQSHEGSKSSHQRRSAEFTDGEPIMVPPVAYDPMYPSKKKEMDLRWLKANQGVVDSAGHFPLNDDVADFAQFMKDKNVKSTAQKGSYDRIDPIGLVEDVPLIGEDAQEERVTKEKRHQVELGSRWKPKNSTNVRPPAWSEEREYQPDGEEAAASEEDTTEVGDSPDAGDDRHQGSDNEEYGSVQSVPRTRVVKDKYVQLPEPLFYNQSHVVSSLVYSMIPFRSPLLSLLDPDRHAKYIMIKVDPVLALSPEFRPSRFEDPAIQETKLEQNLIDLIDRSIVNELSPAYSSGPYQFKHVNSRIKGKMTKLSELAKMMSTYQQINRAKNNVPTPNLFSTLPRS